MSRRSISGSHPPLVVMHTTQDRKDKANPYTLMLMGSMPPEIQAIDFGWVRALVGRCDVVHLHWPELLLRHPVSWKRALRKALFALIYLRLALTGKPVVETVHNVSPHEVGSAYERWILKALSRRTGAWITLNSLPMDRPGLTVQIPHGHYLDWFDGCPRAEMRPGRYLYFGLIRPYKNVSGLIDAFLELDDREASLRIIGACADPEVEAKVAQIDRAAPIQAEFTFVPDDQMALEVTSAELVVLPYRDFYNSGAALLALSLGRPIVIPRTSASVLLQEEFGPEWVFLYSGELSGDHLREATAVRRASNTACSLPDLSGRNWDAISEAHVQLYLSMAG